MSDRSDLWLPLLRRLTEAVPGWLVWKNADRALGEDGDIDSAAPRTAWPTVEKLFRDWACDSGFDPVIVCRHFGNVPIFVVAPLGEPTLFELDVRSGKIWRGSTLFMVEDLQPMTEMDSRGFRRLRPGAEGMLKLLLNGVRGACLPNQEGMRAKGIHELLWVDPEGARMAAQLLGSASRSAIRAAEAVVAGKWDHRAMMTLTLWALAGGLREPAVFVKRIRFRLAMPGIVRRCPVLATIWHCDRRIPADRQEWLGRAAAAHAGSRPTLADVRTG